MLTIGIDIGGSSIKCGCVDEKGKILSKLSAPTGNRANAILKTAARLSRAAAAACSVDFQAIQGIGVGCPGLVDAKEGYVVQSGNIKEFKELNLAQLISSELGKPVFLQNDAYCALLAEACCGAAKEYDRCVMITIGTGIGGGASHSKQELLAGNMIGELGHHVIAIGGRPCSCGNKGCFEAYASCNALVEQMKERLEQKGNQSLLYTIRDRITAEDVFSAYKQQDETAIEMIRSYITYLSTALQNIDLFIKPDVIVIGGGLSDQGDFLLDLLNREIYTQSHILVNKNMNLKISYYKNDAGFVGAALLPRTFEL